jgi:hypothetical protein
MTEPKDEFETADEHVEDLEVPTSQQENVAGGHVIVGSIMQNFNNF